MKKKIAVLTGAGISADSGIPTFRGADGLWEGHRIQDVASPEGWRRNRELVLEFYNIRRRGVRTAQPNAAHLALKRLEEKYNTVVITQNIDDLHERAGSSRIIHLHGEIRKARSCVDESLVYDLGDCDIALGDKCEKGSQLRPHIVWFGEAVPMIERAAFEVSEADMVLIVGTSMVVYPAAGLVHYAPPHAQLYVVDPSIPEGLPKSVKTFPKRAAEGVPQLVEELLARG